MDQIRQPRSGGAGGVPWHDEQVLDLLIEKYESALTVLEEQNQHYQTKFEDFKTGMQELVSENQRLTAELKQTLESQIRSLEQERPEASLQETQHVNALRQQLLTTTEEKENVLEMWRVALREIERLEEQLQERREATDSKVLQEQTLKVKNHYNQAIISLRVHIDKLKEELRRTKEECHAKNIQVSDLRLLLENTKAQILAKDKETSSVLLKERALHEEIKNLQEKLATLQSNLANNLREIVELRENNNTLEEQLGHYRKKSSSLESNQAELIQQLKESVQMTEDALLEKDQALLKLEHTRQEVDRLQIALTHLLDEAGMRTKQEVENSRKACSSQIKQLMEDVNSLQKKNAELHSEAERALRDKQAAVSELEQVTQDIQQGELQEAYHDVQNRLIQSEHRRAELLAELENSRTKARIGEANFRQEEKHWALERKQFREKLKNLERDCEGYSLSKVHLVEQVEQLQTEARQVQRQADAAIRKAAKDCAVLETEKNLIEEQWQGRLQSTEEAHTATCQEFKQLLTSQQRLNIRLKSETKTMTQLLDSKINELQRENIQLKMHNLDLSRLQQEQNEKFSQLNKQKATFYLQIRQLEDKLQHKELEMARFSKIAVADSREAVKTKNGFNKGPAYKGYHTSS